MKKMKNMIKETYPLFANTCGKIFNDHVVFASSMKERCFKLKEISKISFKKRYETGSILFALLPAILFFAAYFTNKDDTFVKCMFITLGILGIAVSLYNAKVNYTLKIVAVNGSKCSISVWEGNKNDAQKFVQSANALIEKYRRDLAKVNDFTTGHAMAKPIAIKIG
ncbi:hypothetical protein ACLI09_06775 [Flavobacterium sp. RHBU_24]|uniref:hypothetical protein n=1 Tax=Flavobacterium sp. RHBU_24 TaxID=3391185 RepID=UPI003984F742